MLDGHVLMRDVEATYHGRVTSRTDSIEKGDFAWKRVQVRVDGEWKDVLP